MLEETVKMDVVACCQSMAMVVGLIGGSSFPQLCASTQKNLFSTA